MAAPRKYGDELRERATRMAVELRQDPTTRSGAIARVAGQLGMHPETLRNWVRQAEIDGGMRPGTTTSDAERLAELERENRELRRANHMADSSSQRNESCEMRQSLITGGSGCRASMVISVVSRSNSHFGSTQGVAAHRHRPRGRLHRADGREDGSGRAPSRWEAVWLGAPFGLLDHRGARTDSARAQPR